MPKFRVLLHGAGCQIKLEERRWLIWKRVTKQAVGFYTTRFVDTLSANEAISLAVKQVQEELKGINLSETPPHISVEEIYEHKEPSDEMRSCGFSFYLEQPKPSDKEKGA